ncbi:MAG: hypothetical protein ACU0CO_07235 [Shimia sp.]
MWKPIAALCALAFLVACGDNDTERALSGAAIGAGVAAATETAAATGAGVGGVAGAFSHDAPRAAN